MGLAADPDRIGFAVCFEAAVKGHFMNQSQASLAEAEALFIHAAREFLKEGSQENIDAMREAQQTLDVAKANAGPDGAQDFDHRDAILAIANKLAAQERVIQTLVKRYNAVITAFGGGEQEQETETQK